MDYRGFRAALHDISPSPNPLGAVMAGGAGALYGLADVMERRRREEEDRRRFDLQYELEKRRQENADQRQTREDDRQRTLDRVQFGYTDYDKTPTMEAPLHTDLGSGEPSLFAPINQTPVAPESLKVAPFQVYQGRRIMGTIERQNQISESNAAHQRAMEERQAKRDEETSRHNQAMEEIALSKESPEMKAQKFENEKAQHALIVANTEHANAATAKIRKETGSTMAPQKRKALDALVSQFKRAQPKAGWSMTKPVTWEEYVKRQPYVWKRTHGITDEELLANALEVGPDTVDAAEGVANNAPDPYDALRKATKGGGGGGAESYTKVNGKWVKR